MDDDALAGVALSIIASTPEIAAIVDVRLESHFLNRGAVRAPFGPPVGTEDESGFLDLVHPDDRSIIVDTVRTVLRRGLDVVMAEARYGTDEEWHLVLMRVSAISESPDLALVHVLDPRNAAAPGSLAGVTWVGETGLPGRSCLLARLDELGREATSVALLICDLDRFQFINESLGQAAGDLVLGEVGRRLVEAAHPDDLVAWLGGDEFGVVCVHDIEPLVLAEALRLAVRAPLVIASGEHVITTSIGAATASGGSGTIDRLAAANAALLLAKQRGRDRAELFDDGLRVAAMATLKRTSELRQAATRNQLRLHFQPIMELSSSRMVGCESLLRWEHPTEGLLSAGAFVHLAEASGLIKDLTPMLFSHVAQAADLLSDFPHPAPYVALNISGTQLGDPAFVMTIENLLQETEMDPQQLVLEITETAVLDDVETAFRALGRLRNRGIGIALDDFGTGFSSFLHLRKLPVTKVKIDRSFISGCLRDNDDFAIVASVIDLAARLRIDCIAEGVETADQAALLRELGCPAGQGYFWSPAMERDELLPWTRATAEAPTSATETDARTKALIMRLHSDGASLHKIAATLNAKGSRTTRDRRWQGPSVAQIIAKISYPNLTTPYPYPRATSQVGELAVDNDQRPASS